MRAIAKRLAEQIRRERVAASLGFTGDPALTSWQVVAPYSAGTLQLPLLDTLDINALETAQVPGGYDAVRAYALSPFGTYWFTAAANGRALVQNFIGQQGQSVVR